MWCTCRVENILTLGKLLSLWFCFLLHSILFMISQASYRTYKIISSYELARPVMGTISYSIKYSIRLIMFSLGFFKGLCSARQTVEQGTGRRGVGRNNDVVTFCYYLVQPLFYL